MWGNVTVQIHNDSLHTVKSNKDFLKAKKFNILHLRSTQQSIFSVTEDKTEGGNTHRQVAHEGGMFKSCWETPRWSAWAWKEEEAAAAGQASTIQSLTVIISKKILIQVLKTILIIMLV